MNKSYRIKTNLNDDFNKNIKLRLDQEYDSFEILSLNINQKDIYQSFNCDYGVVVGRVNANGGVGIPNVRLSIFIPITDDDSLRPEIKAIYPYETPRQKNSEGKRYNLLPRVAKLQKTGKIKPKQPFGSFPTKEEVVTNDSWLEVYDKYYKYSTITNESGDYMLFGVPVGIQTLHMSVDITDIGEYSMTPATMVNNLGYSPNLFTENNTKIKSSDDLDDIPNIETQEISVDVIPFCGDSDNFDIGITRQDFRIRAQLISTFTIFGSAFSDGGNKTFPNSSGQMWSRGGSGNAEIKWLYNHYNEETFNISDKQYPILNETIYVINNNVTDSELPTLDATDPTKVSILDPSEYVTYKKNGDFVFIVPCNRKKIITSEDGKKIVVPNSSSNGVFSEFRGFITFQYGDSTDDDELETTIAEDFNDKITVRPFRYRYKFPQSADLGKSWSVNEDENTKEWRRQHKLFEGGKYYSIAQHYTVINNNNNNDGTIDSNTKLLTLDSVNDLTLDVRSNVGSVVTNNYGEIFDNEQFDFPNNISGNNTIYNAFGGNWLNFTMHFIHAGRARGSNVGDDNKLDSVRYNTGVSVDAKSRHYVDDNEQQLFGGNINTRYYVRSDLHWTDFIEVPIEDINVFKSQTNKGLYGSNLNLVGNYKNGECGVPFNGGKINGDPENGFDPETYFYKGYDESNIFNYLEELDLI